MSVRPPTYFEFEKTRLITRKRNSELWEGAVHNRKHLIKRFLTKRSQHRAGFEKQSRIANSVFLRPARSGYSRTGNFCYAMPVEFSARAVSPDADITSFVIHFLGMLFSLHRRSFIAHWTPDSLVTDQNTGRIVLAGLTSLRKGSASELREHSLKVVSNLSRLAASHNCDPAVLKILKKWERRNNFAPGGCLAEVLKRTSYALESLATTFYWTRQKEIELVRGLYQLPERSKGRAVLFTGERGEGKTILLQQLWQELSTRNCVGTLFSAEKQDVALGSALNLFDVFFEDADAYSAAKEDCGRMIRALQSPADFSQDAFVSNFLRLLLRLGEDRGKVFVVLIDDVDRFDCASLQLLKRIVEATSDCPVLFVMTALASLNALTDPVITLAMEKPGFSEFDQAYQVPMWKEQQRLAYLEQIFLRTSGNALLFGEYFHQTLKQRQSELHWEENEWSFRRHEIPEFPNALLDFYLHEIPPVSAEELSFLETACVQGESFDPVLCDSDAGRRTLLLKALTEKAVLSAVNGKVAFKKPLLAEALRRRMDCDRLRRLHAQLAVELTRAERGADSLTIAGHFLKAGEYSRALLFASKASSGNGNPALASILDDLANASEALASHERVLLYRIQGDAFFRRGNYSSAIAAYAMLLGLLNAEVEQRFEISTRIAQSHLQNNDFISAQKILVEQAQNLPEIQNKKMLFEFYLARAFCGWHRGETDASDFNLAMSIAESLQDFDSLSKACCQRAELAVKKGELPDARNLLDRAMRYGRKTDNPENSGQAYRLLGTIAWRQSKYKSAEQSLKRSLRLFQKAHNQEASARVWSVLGNVYSEQARFRQSVEAFQNALRLFNQQDHPYEISLAEFNLGLVYVEQGNVNEAEKIFLRCRKLDKKTGNKRFYAYDLRALGVVSILRGFHNKARRLLKRTLEICDELQAHGDILQTKMILLFSELEQKNIKNAAPLIQYVRDQIPTLDDAKTHAEIEYLLGHYSFLLQEESRATNHLQNCIKLAKKLRYYRLMGQATVMSLVLKNSAPGRNDAEIKKAIRYFQASRNDLEFFNYLLKLYQAYPALLRYPEHSRKLIQMEKKYREVRNRANHNASEKLLRGHSPLRQGDGAIRYKWCQDLLAILLSKKELSSKLASVIERLAGEMQAQNAVLFCLNQFGTFERVASAGKAPSRIKEDLAAVLLSKALQAETASFIRISEDPQLCRHPWVLLNEINSVLAVPVVVEGIKVALWYMERFGSETEFTAEDQEKLVFFSMVSAASLLTALKSGESQVCSSTPSFGELIGASRPMQDLYQQIERAAPVDISVLVLGESGTGKELAARMIHRLSGRSAAPFLALNCSAIPETLIESELFGYTRGAFTGAVANKVGLIERANGGTLFLDEIGDLSAAAQAKLLRVMQEREIQRIGDTAVRKVNVRFLFATHKDLQRLVKEGNYREDLYYRISVYTLRLPALRERKEDIPLLVRHFTQKYCTDFRKPDLSFSTAAVRLLCEYSWPGNVRELENIIQSVMVNSGTANLIEPDALPAHLRSRRSVQKFEGKSLEAAREEFEKDFLMEALMRFEWNKTHTARELKITRQGLINMIQRLGIQEPEK